MDEGMDPHFPKKGDLRLAKNYQGITLISIAAKIYNVLLRNRIEPQIDNILRTNQNGFQKILIIRRILECVRAKALPRPLIPLTEGNGRSPTRIRPTKRDRRSNNDSL